MDDAEHLRDPLPTLGHSSGPHSSITIRSPHRVPPISDYFRPPRPAYRASSRWPVSICTILLIASYLLAGVIGHDPWKQDEAYTFGMVLNILNTGDWVIPRLGGEPFMEKPPLFYLVAALSAKTFSKWLPLHDGARLAGTVFIAAGLFFTAAAARRLHGPVAASSTPLLVLACFGMLVHSHEMITDTALFAGFAIAIFGLAQARQSHWRAGLALGTGVGIGFMAKGLVEPAMIGLACVALPVLSPFWRNRRYATALSIAVVVALPWLLIWPASLYLRDPDAFATWFWVNNFGRYLGTANLGADGEPWYYTRVLAWFAFPAGPLAALALWPAFRNGNIRSDPAILLLTVISAAMLIVLSTAGTVRSLYALPLLVPFSLLGSSAIDAVPARVLRGVSIAGASLFAAMALCVWLIWAVGIGMGHSPDVAWVREYLPREFPFRFHAGYFLIAVFCTGLWAWSWVSKALPVTPLHRWVAGITMAWGVTMSLLLPWIDEAKSFRTPFSAMATLIPDDACVAARGLGEPQRGMLHYFGGIITDPVTDANDTTCDYLLIQTNNARDKDPAPPQGWTQLWSGSRDGEENEHFTLYARDDLLESPPPSGPDSRDFLLS